jgi:DNA-binding LytR/AlgR family response regulator
MKILIIEDEKHNASRLQTLLTEISSEFEIVGVFVNLKTKVILRVKNNDSRCYLDGYTFIGWFEL